MFLVLRAAGAFNRDLDLVESMAQEGQPLADGDHEPDIGLSGDPGIADELGIKSQSAFGVQ